MARALTEELSGHGFTVVCVPNDKLEPAEVLGFNLLLLGSHSHIPQASQSLIEFTEQIPHRRLSRMAIGVFGTGTGNSPDNLDQIAHALNERGCQLAQPPLRIIRHGSAAVLPDQALEPIEIDQIRRFATELVEALSPMPLS
jgi:flavodoxin